MLLQTAPALLGLQSLSVSQDGAQQAPEQAAPQEPGPAKAAPPGQQTRSVSEVLPIEEHRAKLMGSVHRHQVTCIQVQAELATQPLT